MSPPGPAVCVVTTRLNADEANPTLIDDLVAELVAQGAQVDVDVFDVEGTPLGDESLSFMGARVFNHGPRSAPTRRIPRSIRRALWGVRGVVSIRKRLRRERYDLTVYFGPAFLTMGAPGWIRRTDRTRRLVHVLWDFFPVHQVEIDRLPRGPQNELLRRLEVASMKHADAVVLMTARNAEFFADYYPELHPEVLIHPPWGRRREEDPTTVGSSDRFSVVFGGQLVRGRGVETLLEAVRILDKRDVQVDVSIVGSGPDLEHLVDVSRSLAGVRFVARLPRRDYLALLASADCGVAVTVAEVSVPTFPSKIVDYTRMDLPVVVALEETSDAGRIVDASGAGIAVPAGQPLRLADALQQLVEERAAGTLQQRSVSARRLFDEQLDVARVASALLAQATDRP